MNRSMVILVILGLVVTGILLWMFQRQPSDSTDDRIVVVTTFTPLSLLVEPVAGSFADVEQLVPPGQGIHDYQVHPSDLSRLATADLLVQNGAGIEEPWLDALREGAKATALPTVDFAERLELAGVSLIEADDHHDHEEEEHVASDHGHGSGVDPHIWLVPTYAKTLVIAVRDALVDLDPANAVGYRANADAFLATLDALDQDMRSSIATFEQREFIAFHQAFSYVAREYSLEQVGVIEAVPGESPTPGTIAQIRALVERHNLSGLFTEPQFSGALVEQLAADLGLTVAVLDPMETASSGEDYQAIMRRNLSSLETVLGK